MMPIEMCHVAHKLIKMCHIALGVLKLELIVGWIGSGSGWALTKF